MPSGCPSQNPKAEATPSGRPFQNPKAEETPLGRPFQNPSAVRMPLACPFQNPSGVRMPSGPPSQIPMAVVTPSGPPSQNPMAAVRPWQRPCQIPAAAEALSSGHQKKVQRKRRLTSDPANHRPSRKPQFLSMTSFPECPCSPRAKSWISPLHHWQCRETTISSWSEHCPRRSARKTQQHRNPTLQQEPHLLIHSHFDQQLSEGPTLPLHPPWDRDPCPLSPQ
mmetsp:Transcript_34406/g.135274  ORF Transcript_34406/g.135274 Transcript_34406/m.135274 type:complete len:223 (-) Transcript_34406:4019-4687(-)